MPDIKKNKQSYIPLFLQQKLKNEKGEGSVEGSPGRRPGASKQRRALSVDPQKTFTAPQLEDLIWKTSQTIVELQKQIQRGEETYYEETQSHGSSLFRGFETFIDARDVGTSNGPTNSSRRMPGDYRWFSSSCSNISRHMKQKVFVPTAAVKPAVVEPMSGQKRPPEVPSEAMSPPPKERKTDDSAKSTEEMKTPKEDKSKAGTRTSTSATKSAEPKRRTSRKRKTNS